MTETKLKVTFYLHSDNSVRDEVFAKIQPHDDV